MSFNPLLLQIYLDHEIDHFIFIIQNSRDETMNYNPLLYGYISFKTQFN